MLHLACQWSSDQQLSPRLSYAPSNSHQLPWLCRVVPLGATVRHKRAERKFEAHKSDYLDYNQQALASPVESCGVTRTCNGTESARTNQKITGNPGEEGYTVFRVGVPLRLDLAFERWKLGCATSL
jgi:hypothetical protein